LFNKPLFLASLYQCYALFTLSNDLTAFVEAQLKIYAPHVKVITFTHPVVDAPYKFRMSKFKRNENKMLVNIGAWMRNPFTIFYARDVNSMDGEFLQRAVLIGKNMNDYIPPAGFKIAKSTGCITEDMHVFNRPDSHGPCRPECKHIPKWVEMLILSMMDIGISVDYYDNRNNTLYILNENASHFNDNVQQAISEVKMIAELNNDDYDALLTKNIVFLDLIDAAAVNTIIECIIRTTPVVVNNIRGVRLLLGDEYPLYYNNVKEIPALMNMKTIKLAHMYLKKINIDQYSMNTFMTKFEKTIEEIM
jgi:hypothetical protein